MALRGACVALQAWCLHAVVASSPMELPIFSCKNGGIFASRTPYDLASDGFGECDYCPTHLPEGLRCAAVRRKEAGCWLFFYTSKQLNDGVLQNAAPPMHSTRVSSPRIWHTDS